MPDRVGRNARAPLTQYPDAATRVFRRANPAQDCNRFYRHCARCCEMLIDSHARRVAEIIRDGKNFVSRFTLVEQPLCIGTCCADRKQLRRDSDKSGKEQLLAIELRPESRHGMKQSACESLARARGVIDVLREYFV